MSHPKGIRRVRFEAKRSIAGRRDPKTSYRGTHCEVGVYLFGRYRSASVSFDSSPFSVEYFHKMHEIREYRKQQQQQQQSELSS